MKIIRNLFVVGIIISMLSASCAFAEVVEFATSTIPNVVEASSTSLSSASSTIINTLDVLSGTTTDTSLITQNQSATETAVISITATSTTSTSDEINNTNSASSSDEVVIEELDQEDVDLGDDKTELDAQKDFTAIVRQSKDYYCGPASLATLMTQLGIDTSENTVLDKISPSDLNSASGTNMLALKNAAIALEQNVYLKKLTAEDVLKYIEQTQDPVLIHDEKKGVGGHFSVIKSYDSEKGLVELSDTEAGNIKYSVEDFKHIFTGEVLIISSDSSNEILSNSSTNISDEEAALIWGKYVPVALYASRNGYTTAVNDFRTCTNNALTQKTVSLRNAARSACYSSLAKALGTSMDNKKEFGFMVSYNASYLDPFNTDNIKSEFGVDVMVAKLKNLLNSNITLYNQKQTDIKDKTNQYNNGIDNDPVLKAKLTALDKERANLLMLNNSLTSRQKTYSDLNNEINSGSFVKDGVTFSLGTVGSLVSAQSSTYNKLSSSLNSTLSNLDGQIKSAQNSLDNSIKNYTNDNNKYNSYMLSYYNYDSQYNSLKRQADYYYSRWLNTRVWYNWFNSNYWTYLNYQTQASFNLANENNAWNNAQSALRDKNNDQALIQKYKDKIVELGQKMNTANSEVRAAEAELARLNKIKDFGNAEINRKKGLLIDLSNQITSFNQQITTSNNNIATINADIKILKPQIEVKFNTLKKEIDLLSKEASDLMLEITKQKDEINNEAQNQKNWDNAAEVSATMELKNSVAPVAFPIGVVGGIVQGLYQLVEGGMTLIMTPLPQTISNVGYAIVNIDKVAKSAYDGLKGRVVTVIYIDKNSYVSVYNAGAAVGQTAFDVCTVACTLGAGGVAVKGTQLGKITIDVTKAADETSNMAKVANLIKTAGYTKIVDLFSSVNNVDDILKISSANKITELSKGADVLIGDNLAAKSIVDRLSSNMKWTKEIKSTTDGKVIWVYTSPDGLQSINYREFASSQVEGYTHQATLDLMKKQGASMAGIGEVKFVTKN